MSKVELLVIGSLAVCFFMAILWQVQRVKNEADIVDFGWALSLGFLASLYAFLGQGEIFTRLLSGVFGMIWSIRLATLLWKRVQVRGEDGRYLTLRQAWGKKAQRNFFIFFQAQALLALVLSVSFLIPAFNSTASNDFKILFALAWFIISIGGETLSDLQLKQWRENQDNIGMTCRAGLWRYSRHPNYFFEWLHWFSYVILAYSAPYWELTLVSPGVILFLILKVSGIPPTEALALRTKGQDYLEYQSTTSAFVPWFPKS